MDKSNQVSDAQRAWINEVLNILGGRDASLPRVTTNTAMPTNGVSQQAVANSPVAERRPKMAAPGANQFAKPPGGSTHPLGSPPSGMTPPQESPQSPFDQVMVAIAKNDLATVKQLIPKVTAAKFSLDDQKGGDTPLTLAVRSTKDDVSIADLLLKNGAKVNQPDIDGKTPLFVAVEEMFQTTVEFLLNQNANPNLAAKGKVTPLMVAPNKEIAELLLGKQAKIDEQDESGQTVLMRARGRMIEFLLDKKADANKVDKSGKTAFMMQVENAHGDFSDAELLLPATQSVNQQENRFKQTALMDAIFQKVTAFVKKLVADPRVDLNVKSRRGDTALTIAAQHGGLEIVNVLLSSNRVKIAETNKDKKSALMLAVDDSLIDVVKTLVAADSTPGHLNLQDKDGNTALILTLVLWSFENGQVRKDMLEVLLRAGADQKKSNSSGGTVEFLAERIADSASQPAETEIAHKILELLKLPPRQTTSPQTAPMGTPTPPPRPKTPIDALTEAIRQDKLADVQSLIASIAKLDDHDAGGETPLTTAAKAKNSNTRQIAKLLLDSKKATVDFANKSTDPPLIVATVADNQPVVEFLLDNNARIDQRGSDYKFALYVAIENSLPHLRDLLLARGAFPNDAASFGSTPLYLAVTKNDFDSVQKLVAKGALVDKDRHFDWVTPLMAARDPKIVKFLLEKGADPNKQEKTEKATVLMQYAGSGNLDIAKELLKSNKVDVNKVAKPGEKTALMLAAERGNHAVVELLVQDTRTNVNVTHKDGATALYFAAKYGDTKTIEAILKAPKNLVLDETVKKRTALMEAAVRIEPAGFVKAMFSNSKRVPKIDLPDADGNTALILAVIAGNADGVRDLVAHGANKQIKNAQKLTAIEVAKKKEADEGYPTYEQFEAIRDALK